MDSTERQFFGDLNPQIFCTNFGRFSYNLELLSPGYHISIISCISAFSTAFLFHARWKVIKAFQGSELPKYVLFEYNQYYGGGPPQQAGGGCSRRRIKPNQAS